jgi:oxygen-dependent protoporphyrinogen oxidase
MNTTRDVVVAGGGISGLACAHYLAEAGLDVAVLESGPRAGGVIKTREEHGFLSEVGPNSTLESKPAIVKLVDELGLGERRIHASPEAKKRFILRDGQLQPLPMAPPGLLSSKLFSFGARMRILREPWVPRGGHEGETVAAFIERRFGKEAADYGIDPFVSGVYAGDANSLGVAAAFGMLVDYEREHGSVIKGAIKAMKARRREGGGPPKMLSFDRGMRVLTDALARKLGDNVLVEAACRGLVRDGDGWQVAFERGGERMQIGARAVVVATPAAVAAGLVEPFDAGLATNLKTLPYAPVASVFLGYEREAVSHPLDGFGFLVPSCERRDILGTIFSSSLFPGRAPEGKVALTVFAGGVRRPEVVDMSDEDIVAMVTRETDLLLGIPGAPVEVRVSRWRSAIPQFVPGHEKTMERLRGISGVVPGLYFASNYAAGISVADCLDTAARVSGEAAAALAPTG